MKFLFYIMSRSLWYYIHRINIVIQNFEEYSSNKIYPQARKTLAYFLKKKSNANQEALLFLDATHCLECLKRTSHLNNKRKKKQWRKRVIHLKKLTSNSGKCFSRKIQHIYHLVRWKLTFLLIEVLLVKGSINPIYL